MSQNILRPKQRESYFYDRRGSFFCDVLAFKISIPLSQNSHLPYGGFPTKNDHFGVFWGYHHLTPISEMAHQTIKPIFFNSRLARTMRSSLSLLGFLEFMKVKWNTKESCFF